MTSPRKAASAENSADLAKVIAQAYRDGMAAAEKSFADAAAASRGANDASVATMNQLRQALIEAHARNNDLAVRNQALVDALNRASVSFTARETLETQERIEKLRLEQEERLAADERTWKTEAVRQLGPGVKPLIDMIIAKLGHSLLKGDGTPDGEGRAACLRAVMKIISDPDLEARCRAAIGDKDWNLMLDYFQRQAGGPPASASASN